MDDGSLAYVDVLDKWWRPSRNLLTAIVSLKDPQWLGLAWFTDGRRPVKIGAELGRYRTKIKHLTEEQRRSYKIMSDSDGFYTTVVLGDKKGVLNFEDGDVAILLPMGDERFPRELRSSGLVLLQESIAVAEYRVEFLFNGVAQVWDPINGVRI